MGFLQEWAKAVRAYNLYPEGHPSLASSSGLLSRLAQELAEAGYSPLELEISRTGFKFQGQKISSTSPAVFSLLNHLHQRRLRRITFLPSLEPEAIHEFLQIISLNEGEISSLGGVKAICELRKIAGLEVEEVSFQEVLPDQEHLLLEVREELPAPQEFTAEPEPDQDERTKLRALLQNLEKEDDLNRAAGLLSECVEVLRPLLGLDRREAVLEALEGLTQLSASPMITEEKRAFFARSWGQVLTRPTLETLLNWLARPPEIEIGLVRRILEAAGPGILPQFLAVLSESPRSRLAASPGLILLSIFPEEETIQLLSEKARSSPLSQIASVLFLLSQIAEEKAVPTLRELLSRPEGAVQREAISGLSLIGGRNAARILMNYFFNAPVDQKPLVVAALGSMPPDDVFHFLTQICLGDSTVPLKKSAITALGNLKDPRVGPLLIKILKRRGFFRRLPAELEREAASALAEIGGKEAFNFFLHVLRHRDFSDPGLLWDALGNWEKKIGLLNGN
ncbi:MAG: HEAT repeat domain-containing protein [bacterium]|nr:HEAT repeat domain-containing protein [bacterium]